MPRGLLLRVFFSTTFLGLLAFLYFKHPSRDSVTMVNVGQGDAFVLNIDNTLIVVDGGSGNDISYFLRTIYAKSCVIDYMFITHFHADHVDGLLRLLDHCKVLNLYFNDTDSVNETVLGFTKSLYSSANVIHTHSLNKGDTLNIGDLEVLTLWPPASYSHDDPNFTSIVLLLKIKQFLLFFPGDIDSTVLRTILKEHSILRNVDILKVPHHGSKYSYDPVLYEMLNPRIAFLSYGIDNNFGHPYMPLILLLNTLGTQIYSTANHGTVTVYLDT
ncbi:MBL fold metallo-hydrolase [candidate division WWE3 bacterium]|uniref:MBL fold metallo-hydrolase n=1 Tax=candidate division WWE3 bacterium TaxID=2053526 RepID=A0A955EC71_UNCKA|nr:MBL fold metallo-hydrolase [candidate division WWE3 bacterium]